MSERCDISTDNYCAGSEEHDWEADEGPLNEKGKRCAICGYWMPGDV